MDQEIKIKNIIDNLKSRYKDGVYVDKVNQIYLVEVILNNRIIFGQCNNHSNELYQAFKESALTSIEEDNGDMILGFQFFV